jgi:hypothetical protein
MEQAMAEASGDDRRVIPFTPRHRAPPGRRAARAFQGRKRSCDQVEDWAAIHLPWIRLATAVLGKDDQALEAAIRKLSFSEGDDASLSVVFRRWREAKRDLDDMREALDVALSRSLEALERVSRSPDDLPPKTA